MILHIGDMSSDEKKKIFLVGCDSTNNFYTYMSSGFSLKNGSSVKEQSQGKHSNFEPIRVTLLLYDWSIFLRANSGCVKSNILYTVIPYFDTEIEYMIFKNNPNQISLLCKIIALMI